MARVRISKTPKALSGLEIKMRPGLYGTNGNRQFTLPNQVNSQRFSQQPVDVRDTLQPVAREGANLEAEKGETAMVNIDGIPAHFKIGGKRHSKGGTPLNLPDNSFIFSDTAKMKIKDPMVHAQFGMVPKKSGYTPAEIAKKYDINTFRKILADPNSEDIERKTAEAMISNYNMKLAKLALVQESMKGFPQGIPAVAMPYVMANDINPEELFETQGQEEQPDADMGVSRYGGNMVAQFNTKQYGGLPTAQTGKLVNPDSSFFVQKPKTVVPITQQPMAAGFTQAATTSANLPLQVNNPDLQYTEPGVLSDLADLSLEVLSSPQKLAMLMGTGLFGDKARWEMPSETINRNTMNKYGKPKYPFTAFMADFISPNLLIGTVKAGARGAVVAFEKGVSHAVSRDVAKAATDASFKTLKSLKLPQAEAEKIIISSGRSVTPKRIAVVTKAYEDGTAKAIQLVKKKPALANAPDALATKISNTTLKSASKENIKRTAKDVQYEIGQGVEYVYDQFGNKIVKPIVKKVKKEWPKIVNAAESAYDFTKRASPVVRPLGPSFVKNVLAVKDKYNDWQKVGDNQYVNVNYPGKLYRINDDQTAYEEIIDPNVKIIKKPAIIQTSDMTNKEALQSYIDSTQTAEPNFDELEEID